MQLLFYVSRQQRLHRVVWFCLFLLTNLMSVPTHAFMLPGEIVDTESRSIGEYRADLKTFMKLSKEDDPQLERNAVFNLCRLHYEIVTDSRFETSQQLQGIRAVIAKRLGTFSKDVEKSKLRKQREANKSRNRSSVADPPIASDPARSGTETASGGTGESVFEDVVEGSIGSESDSGINDAMYDSASDSHFALAELSGGPIQLYGYAGGQLGPPWDHGEELVDLITSVIDPSFWRRNGGPGSIHYYQPSLVLVVRASQQGNEEVGDLLQRLRANGRTQLNIGGVGGAIGN